MQETFKEMGFYFGEKFYENFISLAKSMIEKSIKPVQLVAAVFLV